MNYSNSQRAGVILYLTALIFGAYIIINDVNSNRRGRDYFMLLSDMLTSSGINNIAHKRYFNYGIKNDYMRYGTVYPTINILYNNINENIQSYNPWEVCSSAQLIIELR